MKIGHLVILLAGVFAYSTDTVAQDIGQTMLVNQKGIQSVGNANQHPIQINLHSAQPAANSQTTGEYAVADAQRTWEDCGCAKQPIFAVYAGELVPGTQVSIISPADSAVIYYTTDGWTPTEASPRYTGPITINADTRLQAIAEEPNKLPSMVAEVIYTVNKSPVPKLERASAVGGVLLKGTPLRLVIGADLTSESAQVGDRIPLLLDEDVMVDETIVAPKGSPVEARITKVDRAGRDSKPGVLAFQVQSLNAHGTSIPLIADLTLAAPDTAERAQRLSNASSVHVVGALPPGNEAEIEPGMVLTALVGADTPLHR